MQTKADAITDLDLNAYVDGQLGEWRRLEVEVFLSHRPEAAAQVMHDLCLRRELRLALTSGTATPRSHRAAAAQLSRGLKHHAYLRRALRLVPVALVLAMGWLANEGLGPLSVREGSAASSPPAVEAALSARDANAVRLAMVSQPETVQLDVTEMRAATGILLPDFAPDWTIRDAQVYPSPLGPGIELLFDTPDLGRVNHFSVRTDSFSVSLPALEESASHNIAWFQIGETIHVLISEKYRPEVLLATAKSLSSTLY